MNEKKLYNDFLYNELTMTQEEYFAYEAELKSLLDERSFLNNIDRIQKDMENKIQYLDKVEQEYHRETIRLANEEFQFEEKKQKLAEREKLFEEKIKSRVERKATEKIASRLLRQGYTIEFVKEITDLPKETVLKINESFQK